MNVIKRMGIISLVAAIVLVGASTALAKGNKGQKREHHLKGKVTAVENGSITVETKKHGAKQIHVTAGTVYQFKGKKGQPGKSATLADVKQGEKVRITLKRDPAEIVLIKKHHKKHKH